VQQPIESAMHDFMAEIQVDAVDGFSVKPGTIQLDPIDPCIGGSIKGSQRCTFRWNVQYIEWCMNVPYGGSANVL
jgi:hypothetical protein